MKVLVLGGTGFLGARLVRRLIDAGHAVTVVTRARAQLPAIEAMGARPLLGDIAQPDALLRDVEPHDAVVNVARPPFEPKRYSRKEMQALQDLTVSFVRTTLALGKKHDSLTILTQGTSYATKADEVADESWPLAFTGIAEIGAKTPPLVDDAFAQGVPLLVMLPAQIYGAGGLFLERFYAPMKNGSYRVLGRGENRFPWVHVDDAASAYVQAIEKKPTAQRMILADDVACTSREFSDCLAESMGRPRPGSVPAFMIKLIKGNRIHDTVTRNTRVSNALAKRLLDWRLRYPSYREGIPATVAEIEANTRGPAGAKG